MGICSKFRLLMWKNIMQSLRKPLVLGLYIGYVAFIMIVHILLYFTVEGMVPVEMEKVYGKHHFENGFNNISELYWSPCGNYNLKKILDNVAASLEAASICVESKDALEKILAEKNSVTYGLEFSDLSNTNGSLPTSLSVTIRYPQSKDFPTTELKAATPIAGPARTSNEGTNLPVVNLQYYLQYELLRHWIFPRTLEALNVTMQAYPYPKWKQGRNNAGPGINVVMTLMFPICMMIVDLTRERNTRIRELMKINGLENWMLWTSRFLHTFLLSSLVILLFYATSLNVSWDFGVSFIFLTLFICAFISFGMLMSVLTSTEGQACVVTIVLVIFLYVVQMKRKASFGRTGDLLASLLCPFAFLFGTTIMAGSDFRYTKITFKNINFILPSETVSVLEFMIMLIADTIIYLILTIYFDGLNLTNIGVRKPWYYPFQRSTWSCSKRAEDKIPYENVISGDSSNFEKDPTGLKIGAQVSNLVKIYNGETRAVDNISLNIYEDQITTIIGHNGAGKSTFISMLCGILTPTSGKVIVDGYDMAKSPDAARSSLGICLQTDMFFDSLTVAENLKFFSKLRGLDPKDVEEDITDYTTSFKLNKKTKAKNLSGGQKRKLCIAMALCGSPSLILFDEATAGLDIASKEEVYNLILEEKEGSSIIWCTHFLDEAEILGDRIAILAKGKLFGVGTSQFLKKKDQSVCRIVVEKKANCDVKSVTNSLAFFLPQIQIEKDSAEGEIIYSVHRHDYTRLGTALSNFEEKMGSLNVTSYGVTENTLEETFNRAGGVEDSSSWNLVGQRQKPEKRSTKQQIYAIFYKKMINFRKTLSVLSILVFLPILALIMVIVMRIKHTNKEQLLELKLDSYDKPLITVDGSNAYSSNFLNIIGDSEVITYDNFEEDILLKVNCLSLS